MPPQSTDAAEAINRPFEPDDTPPAQDHSAECNEWVNACMNDWLNA